LDSLQKKGKKFSDDRVFRNVQWGGKKMARREKKKNFCERKGRHANEKKERLAERSRSNEESVMVATKRLVRVKKGGDNPRWGGVIKGGGLIRNEVWGEKKRHKGPRTGGIGKNLLREKKKESVTPKKN